jgi:hypothetical protein
VVGFLDGDSHVAGAVENATAGCVLLVASRTSSLDVRMAQGLIAGSVVGTRYSVPGRSASPVPVELRERHGRLAVGVRAPGGRCSDATSRTAVHRVARSVERDAVASLWAPRNSCARAGRA